MYGDGATPLLHADSGGKNEMVELLIAKGADVNAKVSKSDEKSYTRHLKDGQTPLGSANWIFESEHSPEEIARKKAIA